MPAKKISGFLDKAFRLVSDPASDHIISWTSDGKAFVISDEHQFEIQILPKYFRHQRRESFFRQLHLYGFRRPEGRQPIVKGGPPRFFHEYFQRDKPELLRMIKKRNKAESVAIKVKVNTLQEQVDDLKNQYDTIQATQNKILYILSHYCRTHPPPNTGSIHGRNRSYTSRSSGRPAKRPRLMIEQGPYNNPAQNIDNGEQWNQIDALQNLLSSLPNGVNVLNQNGVAMPFPMQMPPANTHTSSDDIKGSELYSPPIINNNGIRAAGTALPLPPSPSSFLNPENPSPSSTNSELDLDTSNWSNKTTMLAPDPNNMDEFSFARATPSSLSSSSMHPSISSNSNSISTIPSNLPASSYSSPPTRTLMPITSPSNMLLTNYPDHGSLPRTPSDEPTGLSPLTIPVVPSSTHIKPFDPIASGTATPK